MLEKKPQKDEHSDFTFRFICVPVLANKNGGFVGVLESLRLAVCKLEEMIVSN